MAIVGPVAAALLDGDSVVSKAGEYIVGRDGSNLARPLLLDATGRPLTVVERIVSTVSAGNSSTTPLGAGATFTGTGEEVKDYAMIVVAVYADVASAVDGCKLEFSSDGVNWRWSDVFTIAAGAAKVFTVQPVARYFRMRYVNGASPQATFDLQVIYHSTNTKPSSHRIQDAIVEDDDAELVKAIITGQKPDGSFVNVTLDTAGALNVVSTPGAPPPGIFTALVWGEVVSGGPNLVAVRETAYTEPTSAAQRSIASNNANDTAAGTGARMVRLTYYDNALSARFTESITLNGTTPVNTVATNIRFIESIEVIEAGSTNNNVGIITLYGAVGGGGGTVGTIAATKNRTNWAHHYTPSGKRLFLASMNGGAKIKEGGRLFGRALDPTIAGKVDLQVTPTFVLAGLASSITVTFAIPIAVIVGPARFTVYVDAAGNDTFYCGFALTEGDV